MPDLLHIGNNRVEIDPMQRTVRITFADGVELLADTPSTDDQEAVARARALGYTGDDEEVVWQMTRMHNICHMLLADSQGRQYSHTLYAAATDDSYDPTWAREEEGVVHLLQRALNTHGEDLLKDFRKK